MHVNTHVITHVYPYGIKNLYVYNSLYGIMADYVKTCFFKKNPGFFLQP